MDTDRQLRPLRTWGRKMSPDGRAARTDRIILFFSTTLLPIVVGQPRPAVSTHPATQSCTHSFTSLMGQRTGRKDQENLWVERQINKWRGKTKEQSNKNGTKWCKGSNSSPPSSRPVLRYSLSNHKLGRHPSPPVFLYHHFHCCAWCCMVQDIPLANSDQLSLLCPPANFFPLFTGESGAEWEIEKVQL